MKLLRALIRVGLHGKLHKKSKIYVNIKTYLDKKDKRIKKLLEDCHINGIGV